MRAHGASIPGRPEVKTQRNVNSGVHVEFILILVSNEKSQKKRVNIHFTKIIFIVHVFPACLDIVVRQVAT